MEGPIVCTSLHVFCYLGFALGPAITDPLHLAGVASRGTFDFGTGPFEFLAFSNRMIFVADRPEGSAHFDSRALWLRILARGLCAPLCFSGQ